MTETQALALIRSSAPYTAGGNIETAFIRWRGANPVEATLLLGYIDALVRGQTPSPPRLKTKFGQGVLALLPLAAPAPTPIPPPPVPAPPPIAGALNPRLPLVKADGAVGDAELQQLARHGYHAINFQAQNGDRPIIDYTAAIAAAKRAGLTGGVWGVSYAQGFFHRDGKALGQAAVAQGAEHVTMDIEDALKNTRPGGGAQPVIDGVRAGGWTGPVHLNTLGGPINPRVTPTGGGNDYGFDYESFLKTGGGVFLQCYFNMADEYRPKPSALHAIACGVPRDRLNITISLAHSEAFAPKPTNRIDGAGWVPLLAEAGVERNFSIFLARHIEGEADLGPLDRFSKGAA